MTWDRICGIFFTALCGIIGGTWTISNTYGNLPDRVDAIEVQQKEDKEIWEGKWNKLYGTVEHMSGQLEFLVETAKRAPKTKQATKDAQ